MAGEMLRHHYALQALLYAVALHRFLRWRLPGYDPEVHLAGVVYLFVRGMTGADGPLIGGAPTGVFGWPAPARTGPGAQRRPRRRRRCMSAIDSVPPAPNPVPVRERDPFEARFALHASGLLRQFNEAGVVEAADVHVARELGRLGGESDETVLLAVALAVRGPRLGHVHVDLAQIRDTAAVDAEEPVDLAELDWPEPGAWVTRVGASPLVAMGDRAAGRTPPEIRPATPEVPDPDPPRHAGDPPAAPRRLVAVPGPLLGRGGRRGPLTARDGRRRHPRPSTPTCSPAAWRACSETRLRGASPRRRALR